MVKEAHIALTQSWPFEDLESVSVCPACGRPDQLLLHGDLVDNVFRVAPGKWTLVQCTNCNSAYLDPRPTQSSIGRAYGTYYTHNKVVDKEQPGSLSRTRLLRRAFANGYVNNRYGTQYYPANRFGFVLARILPSLFETLNTQFRWLPNSGPGQRLLDVGCGNGAFLLSARDAGWEVMGCDTDSKAVAIAQERGLEVREGSIDSLADESGLFDAITVSHVIEHVHNPREVLIAVHRLLKPGGLVYFDTPNIESYGHKKFGSNWRGLETPRHLTLFSIRGFQLLLQSSGFVDIKLKRRRSVIRDMFLKSLRLKKGFSPYNNTPKSLPLYLLLRTFIPFLPVSRLEFITLLARKDVT